MPVMNKERREATSYFSANRIVDKRNVNFGKREYLPYRSKWEKLYAEYLENCGIDFKYEPTAFDIETPEGLTMHYVPDFYLPRKDKYIEIKADIKQITKINKQILEWE